MGYKVERVKGEKRPYKVYQTFLGIKIKKVNEFEVGLKARKYAEKLNGK